MGETNLVTDMALVELPNGDIQPLKSALFVNAAGPWAGEVSLDFRRISIYDFQQSRLWITGVVCS